MPAPLVEDIISAVKNAVFIKDPFFKEASIHLLKNGRPDMYGGGFSQVFPMTKDGEKWAFKVWHTEITNNKSRYGKITSHLKKYNLPYFCNYEYVDKGILVNGEFLDTFRMEWVNGLSLMQYISSNLKNKVVLEKLAGNFLKMTEDLHNCSISHGDLQHDNIFIKENGEIVLIDYDSICVPELEGEKDICRGRPGYQHPSRFYTEMIASVKMDFFSELIIYISMLAIIENPLLWDKYNVEKAEHLLFKHNDFFDFENCEIRRDLLSMSSEIKSLVNVIERYLASHLNLLPFIKMIE